MDFLYVPENIKDAIKNGGKFLSSEHDLHRTIVFGDERSIYFPQFYAMVIIWINFHNLVVNELTRLYPSLPNDVKFYEARLFLIAFYQKTLYTEVLPVIISPRNMAKFRLNSKKKCYDPKIDPAVTVEFTSSVGRYMHTFIQNSYTVNYKNGSSIDILLRHLTDASLGDREMAGVLTGLMNRTWNTANIASEVSF